MKQTAVEWQHIELSKFLYGKSEFTDANDILIKAKEMEKEQIIDTYDAGQLHFWPDEFLQRGEYYYNETFNTNEK
jgi:hypothetical protein